MNAYQNVTSFVHSQSEAKRLELIQQQIRSELDLMPVKESDSMNKSFDPFAATETYGERSEYQMQQKGTFQSKNKKSKKAKTNQQQPEPHQFNSFLNDKMFMDPKEQRNLYMKMYAPSEKQKVYEDDDLNERDDLQSSFKPGNTKCGSEFNYSNTMKSNKFDNSQLPKQLNNADDTFNDRKFSTNPNQDYRWPENGRNSSQSQSKLSGEQIVDFNLTKGTQNNKSFRSGKPKKSVSFKDRQDSEPTMDEGKVLKRADVDDLAQDLAQDKMQELYHALGALQQRNEEAGEQLAQSLTCENPQILEVLMEHIILHWDDIVELLFDELIHEEVQELNKIEFKKEDDLALTASKNNSPGKDATILNTKQRHNMTGYTNLADKSMYGKYHDYKSVDLRDIMGLFDDYLNIEQSIKNKM